MDKRLCDFAVLIRATKGQPDAERYLALQRFIEERDRAPSWYGRLPAVQQGLWAEARAIVVVSLSLAHRALTMTPEQKQERFSRGDCPFDWDELDSLADELDGTTPNRSDERWVAGVKERLLVMLRTRGDPWTKAHARACCQGLTEHAGRHRAAYKALALWAVEQGTADG